MWGCILLDHAAQPNFSIGYTSLKSDAVIHLAQWQYWWWFWFAFLWSFYYLTAAKVIRGHVLKFRPRMYTSYRSHGKWGDFLACIVPAIWCMNILTNSSFILRLLEWQYELSLFSIRLRGRQWYWVYKFELRHILDFVTVPKNIGRDNWRVGAGNFVYFTKDYTQAMYVRSNSTALQDLMVNTIGPIVRFSWSVSTYAPDGVFFMSSKLADTFLRHCRLPRGTVLARIKTRLGYPYPTAQSVSDFNLNFDMLDSASWATQHRGASSKNKKMFARRMPAFNTIHNQRIAAITGMNNLLKAHLIRPLEYVNSQRKVVPLFDNSRLARPKNPNAPMTDLKNINDYTRNFINTRFDIKAGLECKQPVPGFGYTIKQKRVKAPAPVHLKLLPTQLELWNATRIRAMAIDSISQNLDRLAAQGVDTRDLRRLIATSYHSDDVLEVQLSRRLLRTTKTLVLPAQVNMTLITNSYDVVHSWFLPSLGLKMDCVPGRSTHHTFFIDSVGFFYGQCAEICGRYHHHMPVRVCLLPYDHFFVWWQHFGLPRVLNLVNETRSSQDPIAYNFIW